MNKAEILRIIAEIQGLITAIIAELDK